ncbi:MAG TPA: hypothetical protein VNI02_16825, partial [Blastocatellia bacterium]|nr:hypothetical protein [Blastocatellia bacterium]
MTQRFLSHLNLSRDKIRFLFTGHIGCGKSSELEHLRHVLTDSRSAQGRYFPVLLNASEYLDDYDAASADILLAIVTEFAATLRDKLAIDLQDNYFVKRFGELKNLLTSDVEVKEGELSFGIAKTKVQLLKRDPTARHKVREALEPKMSTMLEEINFIFDKARIAIANAVANTGDAPYRDFVLILDNLEKIQGFAKKDQGLESQRELFLERAPQLTGLDAHIIYTVPLQLARSDGPQLKQRYGVEPFVLPMIKIIERGTRNTFPPGAASLRALLQRHLGSLPLGQAFTEEALGFLLKYSGGHARNLMTFVQEACTYTDDIPIPLEAAHRAIQPTVRTYSTAIPDSHWNRLAQLDLSPDQKIDNGEKDYLSMLENLSVLEYMDGGKDDPFALAEPWYAVNP